MMNPLNLKDFNRIYDETYNDVLRFIIIKCSNMEDVNDIVQETYLEFWKILQKKNLNEKNIKSYLLGIALNKVRKHYSLIYKLNTISLFQKEENEKELIESFSLDYTIEDLVVQKDEWNQIWQYIKTNKNQNIPKIFYLYYKLELSIKEISKELNKGESYIKNSIYRTLKELNNIFGKESN